MWDNLCLLNYDTCIIYAIYLYYLWHKQQTDLIETEATLTCSLPVDESQCFPELEAFASLLWAR